VVAALGEETEDEDRKAEAREAEEAENARAFDLSMAEAAADQLEDSAASLPEDAQDAQDLCALLAAPADKS
jgi:hypothetical protein